MRGRAQQESEQCPGYRLFPSQSVSILRKDQPPFNEAGFFPVPRPVSLHDVAYVHSCVRLSRSFPVFPFTMPVVIIPISDLFSVLGLILVLRP